MMRMDGRQQIIGAAIMQEESALAEAPERSSTEHVAGGDALGDVVREALPMWWTSKSE